MEILISALLYNPLLWYLKIDSNQFVLKFYQNMIWFGKSLNKFCRISIKSNKVFEYTDMPLGQG